MSLRQPYMVQNICYDSLVRRELHSLILLFISFQFSIMFILDSRFFNMISDSFRLFLQLSCQSFWHMLILKMKHRPGCTRSCLIFWSIVANLINVDTVFTLNVLEQWETAPAHACSHIIVIISFLFPTCSYFIFIHLEMRIREGDLYKLYHLTLFSCINIPILLDIFVSCSNKKSVRN